MKLNIFVCLFFSSLISVFANCSKVDCALRNDCLLAENFDDEDYLHEALIEFEEFLEQEEVIITRENVYARGKTTEFIKHLETGFDIPSDIYF